MVNTDTVTGNAYTKAAWATMLIGELQEIVWDSRWLLLAIVLSIAADFRYGWGECAKRHSEAVKAGDAALADKYRWRGSRACRRTLNKFCDYLLWVVLGTVIGKGILANVGVPYIYGSVAAAVVAVCCEAVSLIGHFFYLHGVGVERRTVVGFARAFAVAFARRKDADVGDALDDALGGKGTNGKETDGNERQDDR